MSKLPDTKRNSSYYFITKSWPELGFLDDERTFLSNIIQKYGASRVKDNTSAICSPLLPRKTEGINSGRKEIKITLILCGDQTLECVNGLPEKEVAYHGLLRTSYRSILLGALHGVAGESKKIS